MKPGLKDKLLRPLWLRRLFRRIFSTGDTIRRVVQKPLIDAFLPIRGNRALDVGAGRGMYTFDSLQPRYRKVIAVEIRSDHLRYLAYYKRRYNLSNVCLVQASAENLPFKNAICETALCAEVLEHLPNDRQGLGELARILSPGGELILSVPVPPAPRHDGAHVHEGYTYDEIKQLFASSSLSITAREYCFLIISRGVLRLTGFFEEKFKLPPPALFLCYFEHWFIRVSRERFKPYDIVVKGVKRQTAP
jgi:ubiquinone/menaquinone biosynthesis C-methylase UbiE